MKLPKEIRLGISWQLDFSRIWVNHLLCTRYYLHWLADMVSLLGFDRFDGISNDHNDYFDSLDQPIPSISSYELHAWWCHKNELQIQLRTSATRKTLWNDPTSWAISGFNAPTAIRSARPSGSPGGGRNSPFLNQKNTCCNAKEWMKHGHLPTLAWYIHPKYSISREYYYND